MLLPFQDLGRSGVDIDFDETAAARDHLELVDPAVSLSLERYADHLAAELRPHARENVEERKRLAALDRVPGLIVVVLMTPVGPERNGKQSGDYTQTEADQLATGAAEHV